ncbi:MAG TPA: NnrS family protein, partial [Nitrosomonas sp.]|nr:NnrS family protein [Nitrosomonas sp.]
LTNMAVWLVLASNAVFAMLLARQLLPRLWVAKKWRNRVLAPLLGLICMLSITISLISQFGHYEITRYLLGESVQLFALLMLFMGGRMLAPAIAGEFYRQGMELQARVQPRVEAGLIVTIIAAVILTPVSTPVSGILLIISGMLAAIRLFRWQLWHCLARPDLICLGIGYAWLALGLVMLGSAKLSEHIHLNTAIHAITVGALGTLACNVLIRVSLLHVKQYPSRIAHIVVITACMTVAAILRISADFSLYREILLAVSATVWSISFFLVFVILLGCRVRESIRKTAADKISLPIKTK